MNPLKIMNGLVMDGIPPCKAFTCPVTDINTGQDTGSKTYFLTPQLESNLTPCKVAENQSQIEANTPSTRETFANYQKDIYPGSLHLETNEDTLSYVIWGVSIALFFGYLASK